MPIIRNPVIREFLAEFLGVFILCTIGNGSIAQQVTSRQADFLSVNVAYGVAVTFGVYVAFGVSGGHINPAVTLSQAVISKFPWPKVPIFFAAQYLGGFLSSVCVFFIYLDGINHIDGGVRQVGGPNDTAGIFATYPKPYVTNVTAFFDQVMGTALLMCGVLALTNEKNVSLRVKSLEPLVIGFLVMAIGMSFGVNCGYAINPARDFGPRVFTAISGYGGAVFSANNWFFWVPIIGPHVGAVLGTLGYKFLVGMHFEHDLDLLETAAAGGGGGDEAARVGKGKANVVPEPIIIQEEDEEDDNNKPRSSVVASRIAGSRSLSFARQKTLANSHSMLRQNTVSSQLAPAVAHRHVMWRQNTKNARQVSRQISQGVVNDEMEFNDLPEAMSPASSIRDRMAFTTLDSKRPTV